jgi:hypothetical protein
MPRAQDAPEGPCDSGGRLGMGACLPSTPRIARSAMDNE